MPKEKITAEYRGWFSRLECGKCGEDFEIDDDCQDGDVVTCDACGSECVVSRFGC